MPLRVKLLFVALAMFVSVADAVANPLVFVGTVTRIQQRQTSDPLKPFVVTTTVDRVLQGQFPGKRFQFAVHSLAQSGLEVGKRYTVRADETAAGYIVEELQWRRR